MSAAKILKTYFGYDSFRKGQEDIIESILTGNDALAIMPTGAGKSICYQVPALLFSGVTIVISPLISLMQDQVKSLNAAGIHAAYINSSLTENQIAKALSLAARGTYKIIYVAPERLESPGFMQFASQGNISMVTVDEAHCISQWGQDFRPSYLKIVNFIESLPVRPIVSAFTATATEEVKTDIECILKLRNPKVIITGFDRENLYYSVENVSGRHKDDFVVDYIDKHPDESGIIYCATRKNVDALYEKLSSRSVPVTAYHAGMDNGARKSSQEDFIYDRLPVIVATNAFGMGIDKSNVRFVIHYNMPQSMENYYQEAGRAGRDGENARCILLFSAQDVMINKFLLDKKEFEGMDSADIELIRQRDAHRLHVMEGYCKTTGCLRNYILEYFGEKTGSPCDNCGNCHREYREVDMTDDAKQVINCIGETRGRYGQAVVIGTLMGANRARLKEIGAVSFKSYGALAHRSESEIRRLIAHMIEAGYIIQTDGEYSVLRMGEVRALREENVRVTVRTFEERKEPAGVRKKRARSTDSLTAAGFELFEKLRRLRLVIAREEALPPYIIFNDKTLIDMCVKTPENQKEMLAVSGVGANKFDKYGQRFIDEIRAFMADNPDVTLSINAEGDMPEPEREQSRRKALGNAGQSWTADEDRRLADEFESGMKISEIAREHGRTSGGIRARLRRHGLID
ncbi:MAG: DNA helicase RecQ [Lachnospiraceae bacterium]|nr:DNA helicase RecQ [Lachnospiraceae bacterium]